MIDITTVKVIRSKADMQGLDKPLFIIEDPIPIIDSKVIFFDQNIDAFFQINVKQVKGLGAYYADNFTDLNNEHKEILNVWVYENSQTPAQTIEQIRLMVNQKRTKDKKKYMKPGSIQGRVSEMFRRGILKKRSYSKWYYLDFKLAEKCLETGKFPELKKE